MKIDQKDKDILFHLSLNARASLSELAKKTKSSKEVIHYRLKNLEKKGVIEGYYAVINTYKMGKEFYRVYMKTINMNLVIEKKFIKFLKDHPKVSWVVEVDGDLDFLYVVWAKNISEFEEVYNEINNLFGRYIEQKFFSVMTSVYYFKYKYLGGCKDETYKLTGGKIIYPILKREELKLITLLSNQGRLPLIEMQQKLNIPAKSIARMMKEFLREGIITCYTVKVNHKSLGYTQRKVMLNLNDTSTKTIRKLVTFLTYHPLTVYITQAIGQYDLEFEMMEKTHEEFHSLLKNLKNNFPELIKNYFTVVFYNEPKVGQLDFSEDRKVI